MCGGRYGDGIPKQLIKVMGERIVERTARLLRAYGVEDIAISTNNPIFHCTGIPILKHDNDFVWGKNTHSWLKAFYPMTEPVCYIFGDVYFSEEAIKTIVQTETESVEFFASSPPFGERYIKNWAEPFAFKVKNTKFFFEKVEECHRYDLEGRFHREAISWELWQVIKNTTLDRINYYNYTAINDYTCDIDDEIEAIEFERKAFGV